MHSGFSALAHGLPEPNERDFVLGGTATLALWRIHRVVLVNEGVDANPLRDRGLEVVVWPLDSTQQQDAVSGLIRLLV